MTTIRLLLSIASSQNWYLHQLDINTSFLRGYLDEEVYMKCSQGLKVSIKNIVCKLNKSIYGLKQASRQWNQKLTNTVLDLGFAESKFDNSHFTINMVFVLHVFWSMLMILYFQEIPFMKLTP